MTDDEVPTKRKDKVPEKEKADEEDLEGALDDAMDKKEVKEAKQDISVPVLKFDGFTITENDLDRVRMIGNWLTDDVLAHLLRKALYENIRDSRDPETNYDLIVIFPAVMETFLKTCKSSDIMKNHRMADELGLPGWKDMDKHSCIALEFNKRICFFNNDRYVDRTMT